MSDFTPDRQAISSQLKTIEAQNGFNVDREHLHHQMDDLRQTIEGVADPVLKTEYLRRLALLRGQDR